MLELIDNLMILGHEISVISAGHGDINDELDKRGIFNCSFSMKAWMLHRDGYRNKILWPAKRWYFPRHNAQIASEIAGILRGRNIDIIHTNSSVIDVGARVAELLHIPHVWHIREYGRYDYNLEFITGDKYALSYMQRKSAHLIFISRDLWQSYVDRGMSITSKMTDFSVIFDGVSLERYSVKREPASYDSGILQIVICGIVSPHKNQQELLEALSLLPDNIRSGLRCKIIGGSGDDRYMTALKKFCRQTHIADMVEFMGYRSNIAEILRQSHIAVMPSHREAFGRVTIEYMMAGLAVIASDTGANPEIIEDGVTGMIYHLGDTGALADCISTFAKNRAKLASMATAGRENARMQFDSMHCAKKVWGVYQRVKGRTDIPHFKYPQDICPPPKDMQRNFLWFGSCDTIHKWLQIIRRNFWRG